MLTSLVSCDIIDNSRTVKALISKTLTSIFTYSWLFKKGDRP